ncbi:hypothetical protein TNCV_3831981 [Trichonephila clavipes]|nr:hypothetical protein TNCV_3831981 [Trichonephila clavipes]
METKDFASSNGGKKDEGKRKGKKLTATTTKTDEEERVKKRRKKEDVEQARDAGWWYPHVRLPGIVRRGTSKGNGEAKASRNWIIQGKYNKGTSIIGF